MGSGQQHLVRIRHNSVTCWPNLGHGRFGHPLSLPGFNQPVEQFNPLAIYLADIDGSGTIDLIYATTSQLLIYRNQSGNRFAEPLAIALPTGIRFDNSCQLSLADIQGLGVASIMLSVPHPTTQHWRYDLSPVNPIYCAPPTIIWAQRVSCFTAVLSNSGWMKSTGGQTGPITGLPIALPDPSISANHAI